MLGVPYPMKPEAEGISDKYSDKHSEKFSDKFSDKFSNNGDADMNNFQPYPMKPEADRSISIGDDELGTLTPQKLSCNEDDFRGTVQDYNKEHNVQEQKPEIEIVQKHKKKKKSEKLVVTEYSQERSNKGVNGNEIEYKRDGSLAPQKEEPRKIWGKYGNNKQRYFLDPTEEYSPKKNSSNNLSMSERKNSRKDRTVHSTKHRVTFSAEKQPTQTRISEYNKNNPKYNHPEEHKGSMKFNKEGILKKSNMPLYSRSGTKSKFIYNKLFLGREAKPKLKTKDFNQIQLKTAMLKDTYDSGSSNPSSMYTAQTGKRTLKDRNHRKLADSIYGGACELQLFNSLQILFQRNPLLIGIEVVQEELT